MTNMRRQLRRLGLGFDNRRTFATIDDEYYRWTQWIFLQIWDAWYDADAVREDGGRGRARPISELVEEFESGRRAVPRRRRPRVGRAVARPSGRGCSRTTASPTPPRLRSTGARVWARCCPTRRSPTRGGPSEATTPSSAQPLPVEDADHGLRRPSGRRPRRRRLARERQAHAAQLDRAVPGRPRLVPRRHRHRRGTTASTSSRPGPTRSSGRPSWSSRPSTRSSTSSSRGRLARGHARTLEGCGRRSDARPRRRPWRHTSWRPLARATSSGRPRARTRPACSPAPGRPIPLRENDPGLRR